MTYNVHTSTKFFNKRKSESGFTLIEVAVALLVLAVGLLGVSGLQSSGIQTTLRSHQRAIAMTQAQNISDRIRANLGGLRSTDYTNAISGTAPNPTCMTSSNTCTSSQLAATDLYNWQVATAALLPSGQGNIACTDINAGTPNILEAGSNCLITIRWDGNRNGAVGTGCSGSSADLTCLRMSITP